MAASQSWGRVMSHTRVISAAAWCAGLQESGHQRLPQATGGAGDDDTACFKAAHGQTTFALSACMRAWRYSSNTSAEV